MCVAFCVCRCKTCLTHNDKNAPKCIACELPNPANSTANGGSFGGSSLTGPQGSATPNLLFGNKTGGNSQLPQSLFPQTATPSSVTVNSEQQQTKTPCTSFPQNLMHGSIFGTSGTVTPGQNGFQTPAPSSTASSTTANGPQDVTATPMGDSLFQPSEKAVSIKPSDSHPMQEGMFFFSLCMILFLLLILH